MSTINELKKELERFFFVIRDENGEPINLVSPLEDLRKDFMSVLQGGERAISQKGEKSLTMAIEYFLYNIESCTGESILLSVDFPKAYKRKILELKVSLCTWLCKIGSRHYRITSSLENFHSLGQYNIVFMFDKIFLGETTALEKAFSYFTLEFGRTFELETLQESSKYIKRHAPYLATLLKDRNGKPKQVVVKEYWRIIAVSIASVYPRVEYQKALLKAALSEKVSEYDFLRIPAVQWLLEVTVHLSIKSLYKLWGRPVELKVFLQLWKAKAIDTTPVASKEPSQSAKETLALDIASYIKNMEEDISAYIENTMDIVNNTIEEFIVTTKEIKRESLASQVKEAVTRLESAKECFYRLASALREDNYEKKATLYQYISEYKELRFSKADFEAITNDNIWRILHSLHRNLSEYFSLQEYYSRNNIERLSVLEEFTSINSNIYVNIL